MENYAKAIIKGFCSCFVRFPYCVPSILLKIVISIPAKNNTASIQYALVGMKVAPCG